LVQISSVSPLRIRSPFFPDPDVEFEPSSYTCYPSPIPISPNRVASLRLRAYTSESLSDHQIIVIISGSRARIEDPEAATKFGVVQLPQAPLRGKGSLVVVVRGERCRCFVPGLVLDLVAGSNGGSVRPRSEQRSH
uniref:Uncharacterized protein n=1 Tax=Leersia perrieri TaxID=77586 RepID=A0A0D9W3C7_9ORYZ